MSNLVLILVDVAAAVLVVVGLVLAIRPGAVSARASRKADPEDRAGVLSVLRMFGVMLAAFGALICGFANLIAYFSAHLPS